MFDYLCTTIVSILCFYIGEFGLYEGADFLVAAKDAFLFFYQSLDFFEFI